MKILIYTLVVTIIILILGLIISIARLQGYDMALRDMCG